MAKCDFMDISMDIYFVAVKTLFELILFLILYYRILVCYYTDIFIKYYGHLKKVLRAGVHLISDSTFGEILRQY